MYSINEIYNNKSKDNKEVIVKKYLPINTKRRSGIKMDKVGFIVLHDTGNKNSTALNNVNYYINSANDMSASAHIFIDDEDIIECIPCIDEDKVEKSWHVLYEKKTDNQMYGDDANDIAIGVELCYFNDIDKSKKAYINYINTVAYLCYLYELDPKVHLVSHKILDPQRKYDPLNALDNIDVKYEDMLIHINSIYVEFINQLKQEGESMTIKNMLPELTMSGYKTNLQCPDIKVAQMELTSTSDWNDIYDDMPLRMSLYKDSIYYKGAPNISVERHSYNTGEVIRTICTDAKIYLLPTISSAFKWCSDNDIDIISVSLSGTFALDSEELKFEDKIFNLISSGNNGIDSMSATSKKKHWTSIGAVHLYNGNITVPYYSSTGEELDFTSFAHLKLSDGNYHNGTSYSAPFTAGILAQFYQLHYNYFGYKPTPKKAHEFLMRNAIDLREDGHDNYTGNGLVYLPVGFDNFAYGEMADWDNYVIKTYPNGIDKSSTVKRDILKEQLKLYMKNNNIKQVRC